MIIFNYHPITKEFLSTSVAELDPIDKLPMIPINGTLKSVIIPSNQNKAVFDGTEWIEVEDHRGTIVYDINTKDSQIYKILGTLPTNLTKLIPNEYDVWDDITKTWKTDIILLKDHKIKDINNNFNLDVKKGFMTSLTIKMDSNIDDILKLDAGVQLAQNLTQTTLNIRDFDNIIHNNISISDVKIMVNELGSNYQNLLNKKWLKHLEIENALTEIEINAVSWLI